MAGRASSVAAWCRRCFERLRVRQRLGLEPLRPGGDFHLFGGCHHRALLGELRAGQGLPTPPDLPIPPGHPSGPLIQVHQRPAGAHPRHHRHAGLAGLDARALAHHHL